MNDIPTEIDCNAHNPRSRVESMPLQRIVLDLGFRVI